MRSNNYNYIVVWCDSPLGLISTRVYNNGKPVTYCSRDLPSTVRIPGTTEGIFAILNKRDGTMVALHEAAVRSTFGWDI